MKNTRFNVQRGMINDSDSYASEIGTAYGPPSVKQSYENLDPKRFQSERGAKKAEDEISADVKSGIKSHGNKKSEKQSSGKTGKEREPSSLHDVKESGRSSSSSSDLSSSVYSSTISSHLSGDEQLEKHHIKDVFAGVDENEETKSAGGNMKEFEPIREAIPEQNSEQEHSSKAGTEYEREKHRSQSETGRRPKSKRTSPANGMVQSPTRHKDNISESEFSLDSLSERSDLNPEQVEALVKRYYERRKLSWNTLSFWEKAKLFKMWYFVSMIGNLCTIFGSMMFLMSDIFEISNSELLIGAGAFCTWSSITKYLRNTQSLNVIMRTFHEAIPMIAKVWLGILPVYIGVCFLTITVVYEFPASFGTATSAFYTFFSLQAGDALYDTYTSMRKVNFIYALLFMYCFLFFLVSIM